MKKTIKATNIELTDAVSSYTDKLVSGIEKYIDKSDESALVDIEVGRSSLHHRSGDIFRAEATVHTRMGSFRAEAEATDIYSAIDDVKDEISKSLQSQKKRRMNILRRGGLAIKNMVRGVYERGRRWKK